MFINISNIPDKRNLLRCGFVYAVVLQYIMLIKTGVFSGKSANTLKLALDLVRMQIVYVARPYVIMSVVQAIKIFRISAFSDAEDDRVT